MVNFKYLSLPLLVGLIYGRTALAACSISYDKSKSSFTASTDCKVYDNGPYFVRKDPDSTEDLTGFVVQYTNGQTATYTELSEDQTGYFRVKSKYYECTKGVCKEVTASGSCSSSNIGKLVGSGSDTALCLAEYDTNPKSYPTVKFNTETDTGKKKYYFVQHKKDTPFSLDSSVNYYAVTSFNNTILIEKPALTFKEDGLQCAKASTGESQTRIEDFCSSDGAGKYFECDNQGYCKSYKQSKPDVQETNGDKCTLKSGKLYEGNCVTSSDSYYLLDGEGKIIDSTSTGTKIGNLGEKDTSTNQFTLTEVTSSNIGANYYYLNADVFTKETYPLIMCESSTSCKLTKVEATGYYLNVPSENGSNATGIKCTLTSATTASCEKYNGSKNCNEIGGIKLSDKKFCATSAGVDLTTAKEYLITVEADKFPGVTTKSNIAVKVDTTKGTKVVLVDKKSSCSQDNEIIKKADGKFYYCTSTAELEMKDGGAKFVNKNSGSYQLVQINAIGTTILTADNAYNEENVGYYVDRTKNASGLVYCVKETVAEGQTDPNRLKCTAKSTTGTEIYINSEKNFVLNQKELNAQLIVCNGSSCEVPEDLKFGLNKFFTNSGKGLIKCDDKKCEAYDPKDNKEKITEGYYINGIKDLSLIKCTESTDKTKVECQVSTDNPKNAYYVGYDDKLITCDDKICESIAAESLFVGENEGKGELTYLSKDAKIIKCSETDPKCVKDDKPGNYYVDNSQKALVLIRCTGTTSITCEKNDKIPKDRGVYISDNGKKLIACTKSECSVIPESDTIQSGYYYINGEVGNVPSAKPLIKGQTSASARKRDEPTDKWVTSNGEENAVYVNRNKEEGENKMIYCTSANACTEVSGDDNTKFMNVKTNKIMGIDDKKNDEAKDPSETKTDKLGFIVDKKTAKILSSPTSDSKLVYCEYSTESWSCSTPTSLSNFYITSSKDLIITGSNAISSIVKVSEIGTSGYNGYFVNKATEIIKCDSTNGCAYAIDSTSTSWCEAESDQGTIKGGYICIKASQTSSSVKKESVTASAKNYFTKVTANAFPGESSTTTILININGNKILQVKFTEDVYYLVNDSGQMITSGTNKGKAYKCEKNGGCVEQTTPDKNYPNFDGKYNIKCVNNASTNAVECTLSTIDSNNVYCVSNTNSLLSCKNNCSNPDPTTNTACTVITAKVGYYLPYEKDGLIQCTSGDSCSKTTELTEGYYKSEDISKQLIRCNRSLGNIRCDSVNANNGYYITSGSNLVGCEDSKCTSSTGQNGEIYLSGDSEYLLLECSSSACSGVSKPKEGWYHDSKNRSLILCETKNNVLSCKKQNPPNDGHFILAISDKKLVSCNSNVCDSVPDATSDLKYFINGENKKLLKCLDKCEKINDGKNWYKTCPTCTEVIKCNDDECVKYTSLDSIFEGFYVNGDMDNSHNPLLYNNQVKIEYYAKDIVNGWYVNADTTSKSMIRCKIKNITENGKTAECVEEKFEVSSCPSTESVKFIKENGELKWCYNNVKIPKGDETKEVVVNVKNANTIPWITEVNGSNKVAIFTVTSSIISQKKVDGYYYDSSSKELYFCNGSGTGLCENVTKEGGYYLDYSGSLLYRCDSKECSKIEFNKYDATKNVGCSNSKYNVVIHGSVCTPDDSIPDKCDATKHDYGIQFSLCKKNSDTKQSAYNLSQANIDYVYALENKYFPSADMSNRYILVNVNKYSVTFKETIKEISECGEKKPSANENAVCLKNNKLHYQKTLSSDTNLNTAKVNIDGLKKDITYDYETNKGYYEYKTEDNKSVLDKVYIEKSSKKLECQIGSACIEREKSDEPVTTFDLKNGVLMSKKESQTKANEVEKKIMDGIYINKDNDQEAIQCSDGRCEWINMGNSISYDSTKGVIKVGDYEGTGLYNQLVFESSEGSLRKRSDSEDYFIMKELTTVQYSSVEDNNVYSNIIINSDKNRIITNDVDISSDKVEAYICIGNKCSKVSKEGSVKKYLLNSSQKGKKENAYVVCHDAKCELQNAEANLLFENYAARGKEDALIKCTSESCDTIAVSPIQGLPECVYSVKSDGTKELVKTELTGRCISSNPTTSSEEVLLEGQHCIMDGIIYNYECKKITESGIKLFDGTYRSLDISKINGEHFGASMYDCPNITDNTDKIAKDCYLTTGYIVGSEGYSVCDSSNCLYYDESNLDNNCDISGEGALITDNKLCIQGGESVEADGYYTVNIKRDSDFPETVYGDKILIKISSASGKTMTKVISDGYLLVKSENQLITDTYSNEGNKLIKCSESDKTCELVENPSNGYYRSDKYGKVIQCTDKCIMIEKTSISNDVNSDLDFSENDDKLYYAIESKKFPGSSSKVIAEADKYSITVYKTDNYVLLNEDDHKLAGSSDTSSSLYICNSKTGKCEEKYNENESISDGWYISGQEGVKAIKCTSGKCEVVETLNTGSCKSAGDLIFNNNQYSFCLKSNSGFTLSSKIGEFATFSLTNVFPNGKNYVVVNVNSVVGLGYIDDENTSTVKGITKCSNQCKIVGENNKYINIGEYCINIANSVTNIYKYVQKQNDNNTTTNKCEKQFESGINVEIFRGNTLVSTAEDAVKEGNQMFYCNNGECSITAGYKKIADSFYRCEYGKCSLSSGTEPGDVSSSTIYTKTDNAENIEDGKYYYISGSHHFPGAESLDTFIVETSSDYAVVFKGEGYYLVDSENKLKTEADASDSNDSNDSEDNVLYYCDGNETCKELESDTIGNGYYFNSAIAKDDRYKKGIIACKNGSCDIVDSSSIISESVKSCADAQIGKLISATTNKVLQEYQLCTEKGKAPISVKKTDDKSSYYVLTLVKDSSFGGIVVNDDNSIKIVVEIKKDYIKQYNGEGYIIIGGTGELLQSVGNAEGTLYNCENKGTDGVKCVAVTQPKNGWYFNNIFQDKRHIKFDGTKVGKYEIVNAKEAVKCDSTGYIIYNNGFKLCLRSDKIITIPDEFEAVMNVPVANTFPGVATDNKNILISVEETAIYQLKLDTNIVAREDDIIASRGDWGKLYQCTTGECTYNEIPRDNYYLKKDSEGKYVDLVYCLNRRCKIWPTNTFTINGETKNGIKEGFRVGNSREYPLIQCVLKEEKQQDGTFITTGIPECKERELKEGWYLSAESTSGGLIRCTKEFGCEEYGVGESGWYINGAVNYNIKKEKLTERDVSPIIKCESSSCALYTEDISTSCTKIGEIISSSGYKLCTDKKSTAVLTNSVISIINNELLPGASTGYIAVKLGDNRAILADDGNYAQGSNPTTMYECKEKKCDAVTSENKNGAYLFENVSEVLMKGTCANGACTKWDKVTAEGNYILDSSDKLVTSQEDSVNKIYECIKTNNVLKCRNMIDVIGDAGGYYFTKFTINNVSTNVIYEYKNDGTFTILNYSELDKCTLLYYKEGVCYISYQDEPDYSVYSDTKPEPTIEAGKLCLYETKSSKTVYFAYKEINTGIDNANCVAVASLSTTASYKVNSVINFDVNKYYARSRGVASEDSEENPACTYDFTTQKCTGKQLSAGQVCTSSANRNYLIKESSGSCVNHINGRGYSYDDSNIVTTYYTIGSSEKSTPIYFKVNGSMYKLESSGEITKLEDGIYIIDNANKLVHIASGKSLDLANTNYKVYVCTSSGCVLRNACDNTASSEYIYDNGSIIKCNPKTNKMSYINGDGYYVNGPWSNLMSCTSGTCKVINEKGMEGYYIDSGNDESIIKCIREKDVFKCKSEEATNRCTYNYDSVENTSTCKAKTDISRNSYCLYIVKDSNGNITQKPKLLYVENFIKAKDTGDCISISDSSEVYYHYRKSRFLGAQDKNEVLKVSKSSIVRLYEKDLGYYIISTKTRKGITESMDLNKSRLYECTKDGCIEQLKPVDHRIYINKASDEKMVRFIESSSTWEVIMHNCRKNEINYQQCTLSTDIDKNEIIYKVNDDDQIDFMISTEDIDTANVVLNSDNKVDVTSDDYLYVDKKSTMYLLDESKQFFDIVKEKGYYIFKTGSNYNLQPYKTTVNVTTLSGISVYKYDSSWIKQSSIDQVWTSDRYILNKADKDGEGLAIQIMNIKDKVTPEVDDNNLRKRDDGVSDEKLKMKSVINKCTSTRKNYCQVVQANQKVAAGEVCVVTEGDFKGIYLAIGDGIENKSSSKQNCIKYDEDSNLKVSYDYLRHGYYYLGITDVLFAGNYHSKLIADIDKDVITLFDNRNGYYVITNDDNKLVYTTTGVKATAYECKIYYKYYEADDDEGHSQGDVIEGSDKYECRVVNPGTVSDGRYYLDSYNRVLFYKGSNWNVDNKNGYYFFNEDGLTATTEKKKVDQKNVDVAQTITKDTAGYDGYYISASNLDKTKVIVVKKENGSSAIQVNYNKCTLSSGKCTSTDASVVLASGDYCYISGKLYVVEEKEGADGAESTYYCYTGTTGAIKYRYIDNEFFRLDGNSIQQVTSGIYVLNSEWSEFSSTYPEIPAEVIQCDGSSCELIEDKLSVEQDVIINSAATGNNKLMKYYSETNKYINVSEEGYYFFNNDGEVDKQSMIVENYAFYVNSSGEIKKLGECTNGEEGQCFLDSNNEYTIKSDFDTQNIYVNSAKANAFIRGYSAFADDGISYDSTKEVISYSGNVGSDDGENVLVFVEEKLYAVRQKFLEAMDSGLYVLEGTGPLVSETGIEVDSDSVCFYENINSSTGACDSDTLEEYKKQKYMINKASKKPTIVEYDTEEGLWRKVGEDGIYFFFEDDYSISESNRRVARVYEIVKGEVLDITNDENRIGYYQYDSLMIESNTSDGWEDAVQLVKNVEVSDRRMCISYELNEEINSEKFCYDTELGICIPKSTLTNTSEDVINCIFSYDQAQYLFLIGDKLFSISGQAFKNIKKSGLYVVGNNNMLYEGKLENKANAYSCENGVCQVVNDLTTGYYLNMANGSIENPTILFYNGESKTWRLASINGNYFFNSKGYAAKNGDAITFAYELKENGSSITNIISGAKNGIYINSAEEANVIVEYKNRWQNAKEIPGCTIGADKKVTSDATLKTGDVCTDGKTLILITKGAKSANEKREEEVVEDEEVDDGSIVGVAAEGEATKYNYDPNEKIIVKLENGNIYKMEVNGYAVIDKDTSLPVESVDPVKAVAYKCTKGKCNEATVNADVYVLNVISEELPLVKSAGNSKWSVETEVGFYFFGTNYEVLAEGGVVGSAVEVEENGSGLVQRDISESKKLGYYVNKAAKDLMIVSNDEYFWSKGTAPKKCVIATVGEGDEAVNVCRTSSEKVSYVEGDLCVVDSTLYMVTGEVTSTGESENCIAAGDKTKYVGKDAIAIINGVDVDYLIRMNNNGINKANNGYYYLNADGEEVDSNEGVEVTMYNCVEDRCDSVDPDENVKYLTEKGEIFETVEEKLSKITKEGLYFFNENSIGCSTETDKVSIIVEVTSSGNEKKDINGFSEGAYINAINNNSIAVYEDGSWSIKVSECTYEATTNTCASENDNLVVGDICVISGTIYFVTEISGTEEEPVAKCLPGDDTSPFYFKGEESEDYIVVKKNSIGKISEEGYYALDVDKNVALHASEMTESVFMKCDVNGKCVEEQPLKMASYLNKAPSVKNIVHFAVDSTLNTTTIETQCKIEGSTCTLEGEGELESGELCVASGELYLVKEEGQCVKTEKFVERYQFVNNKIYKMGDEVVIQMFDGYYFMNGDNRAIGSAADYANPDTVGYMCSVKGDCYLLEPDDIIYYKDYTTIQDDKFKVVMYDPDKVAKRSGNSGYSCIEEAGIYQLDDGTYIECDYETNGEVSCKNIEEEVTKMTNDEVVIVCSKNDDKEIECVEATEGGYYWINDDLYECEANEDVEKLTCELVQKEGYFLSKSKDQLYECNEKKEEEEEEEDEDAMLANVLDDLNSQSTDVVDIDNAENVEGISPDEESSEIVVERREGEEGGEEGVPENEGAENDVESNSTVVEEPTATETIEDIMPTPVDVTCKAIECDIGTVIPSGAEGDDVLYVCVKVEKETTEDGENDDSQQDTTEDEEEKTKWVSNKCTSGINLKLSDDYYRCEDEKDDVEKEIPKPNTDHTSTEKISKTKTKTAKATPVPTSSEEEVTTTTTTTVSTSKEEEKPTDTSTTTKSKTTEGTTAAPKTTATTTTASKTTTSTSTSSKPTSSEGSGALSRRNIPSIVLYLALFFIALYLHF